MTVALALAPEHRAEFDRICEEHKSDPPAGRIPSRPHRYERYVEPAVGGSALKALRANPMADSADAPKPARTRLGPAERLKAFGEAVAAKYPLGSKVSIAMAAEAAGVSDVTAYDRIRQLKGRGDWPFAPGTSGQRAKVVDAKPAAMKPAPVKRAAIPSVERLDLSGGVSLKPAPATAKPVEAIKPEPVAVAPAPQHEVPRGGLAAISADLRRAADMIDEVLAILARAADIAG